MQEVGSWHGKEKKILHKFLKFPSFELFFCGIVLQKMRTMPGHDLHTAWGNREGFVGKGLG